MNATSYRRALQPLLALTVALADVPAQPEPFSSLPPAAAGQRYRFVTTKAPNASDDNDGSQVAPWKTLSHAAEQVLPGDTVWVGGGVYRETVKLYKSGEGPGRRRRPLPGRRPGHQRGHLAWSLRAIRPPL
ncbi:MAG: hypothetical protein GW880_04935, partial [Armatimonadetes bacterium]|nr:hypothetical protein [Armatimonadota bacterium]